LLGVFRLGVFRLGVFRLGVFRLDVLLKREGALQPFTLAEAAHSLAYLSAPSERVQRHGRRGPGHREIHGILGGRGARVRRDGDRFQVKSNAAFLTAMLAVVVRVSTLRTGLQERSVSPFPC
jgi:hypothetical protein